jgi:predicted enzyme related to lactoylglutathione lyase
MELKLNFLGVTVADFALSYRFYTETLGIEAKSSKPDWALLQTTGMTFELFSGGVPPSSDRTWGQGQTMRPGLQVADLQGTVSELRRKGVTFVGAIERTRRGERIEFIAPEGIRWTLAHAPGYPFASSLLKPHLGWVEMKAHNLTGQRAFYADVMGLRQEAGAEAQVVFRQEPGAPLLFLESGGQPLPAVPSRMLAPTFISFETDNIEHAADWIKSRAVPVLTDITHREWGGIDLIITDADGNPVQVVQYIAA